MTHEKPNEVGEELSTEERFSQAYEGASIAAISSDDVPPEILQHFESKSRLLVSPEYYVKGNFTHFSLITHPNDSKTYVAEQIKSFNEGSEKDNFVYFVDEEGDQMAGYGELINTFESQNHGAIGKPYVGFTRTYGPSDKKGSGYDFRRKGLGRRRLIEMNAYAQTRFGYPLHSSRILVHDNLHTEESAPRRIWESLVKEGKAESYMEGKGKDARERFRMK